MEFTEEVDSSLPSLGRFVGLGVKEVPPKAAARSAMEVDFKRVEAGVGGVAFVSWVFMEGGGGGVRD